MNTSTTQGTTENDKQIIEKIVTQYKKKGKVRIKQAFKENPEWEAQLKHLSYSTITYHIRQLILKERKQTKKEIEKIVEKINADPLSYCPCCGKYLVNIRNAMLLEEREDI